MLKLMKLIQEKLLSYKILYKKITGVNKIISTSKIKNIILIKRKGNENDKFDFLMGLNPRSNGDLVFFYPNKFIKY